MNSLLKKFQMTLTRLLTLAQAPKPEPDRHIILRTPAKAQESKPQPPEAQEKPRIDWNGIPPVIAVAPLRIPAFLTKKKENEELTPQRLAEITRLRFPMDLRNQENAKP
jgi:hypothetical protein